MFKRSDGRWYKKITELEYCHNTTKISRSNNNSGGIYKYNYKKSRKEDRR